VRSGAGLLLSVMAGLVLVLLLAPVAVVMLVSFSADSFIIFPPSGYSLRWYSRLFGNEALMRGLALSLQLAVIVTLASLAVGVPAAFAIADWCREQGCCADFSLPRCCCRRWCWAWRC
jgi:putative spermidine/putrescine transport system permease protein